MDRVINKSGILNKTAFVLVDMQENEMNGFSPDRRSGLVKSQEKVLDFCAERNMHVYAFKFEGHGELVGELNPILARVPRRNILLKRDSDCFSCCYFNPVLHRDGIRNLIIGGVNASYCVLVSADSAKSLGYNLGSAEDLMGDSDYVTSNLPSVHSWFRSNSMFYDTSESLVERLKKF
ncbi:MAG: cysteine hydrolase family protein [Nanoarchaeota archaeon]